MFIVEVNLKDIGSFDTINKAVEKFIGEIKGLMDSEKGYSRRFLETLNFVVHYPQSVKNLRCIMNFYRLRDFAHSIGLMRDGELTGLAAEIPNCITDYAFLIAQAENLMDSFEHYRRHKEARQEIGELILKFCIYENKQLISIPQSELIGLIYRLREMSIASGLVERTDIWPFKLA